jgi:uncharacterized protein
MKRFINFIERAPWWVIIITIVFSLAAVPGILKLKTDSSLNSLVSPKAAVSQDTRRYQANFGDEPITILLSGPLDTLFDSGNLAILSQFEAEFPSNHDCIITSPLTLLNQALAQAQNNQQILQDQITRALQLADQEARNQAAQAGLDEAAQEMAARQAQAQVMQQFQQYIDQQDRIGPLSLDNPNFVNAALYSQDGSLNSAFLSLVPDNQHALIVVTPTGDVNAEASLKMSHDVEDYFAVHTLRDTSWTITGYSLVTEGISQSMKSNLLLLLGLAVLIMVVVLFVLFRVRWRLLSLLMVGLGALWTFGLMGYIPIYITMATMSVLPILIGLGIDYPIQFHNRYQEEVTRTNSIAQAVLISFIKMAPAVGIALLATVVGFATLYFSDVPMIRDFGIILVVGVVFCYVITLFLLYSIIYLGDRKVPISRLKHVSRAGGDLFEKILVKIVRPVLKYPLSVLLIALVLGTGGLIADRWLPANTDYQELIPQDLKALKDVRNLNGVMGIGGQIKFMVEADDITSLAILQQLNDFTSKVMKIHPELISVNSPATISGFTGDSPPTQLQIDQILTGLPSQLVRQYISSNHKMASLSFGTRYMSLDKVHDLIEVMKKDSEQLKGIRLSPVGTIAMSVTTIDSLIGRRFILDGFCLGAIFIVLLLLYRRLMRTLFIIVSVGLVIGWSSLALFISGIPLNPLTSVLGIITTAIGTEFMVLLTSRYEEEKSNGEPPRQAMLTAVSKMGRAIVTTGITTLGGFGVLIASNFVMIQDFGIATVIGIFLCLISTMVVMPPLMVWWDERTGRLQQKKSAQ